MSVIIYYKDYHITMFHTIGSVITTDPGAVQMCYQLHSWPVS